MDRETFSQRLAPLSARQESLTTELVEEYRKNLAELHATALRYLSSRARSGQASSLLEQLEETAVESLARTVATQHPAPETRLLLDLANGVGFAEKAVVSRLTVALRDGRIAPQPPGARAMEEAPPPHRVCDEAYIGLRRLLHPESQLQNLMESNHFLGLPDHEKNREIESWLKTGAFRQFLDDVDVEEER